MEKTERNVQGVWSNYRSRKMHILVIAGEGEKSTEEIFETTVYENFLLLMSNNKSQLQ